MAATKTPVKAVPIVIEGLEITAPTVTFQRLQEFSLTLYERLLLQRVERNRLMLDRDKLVTVLTNLRHQIRETETATVNMETELERAEERFRQDNKEVEQEVKYLEYDHKINLEQLKMWEGGLVAKVEEDNMKEMLELLEEKRKMKEQVRENEMKFEEQLMNLKKTHAQEIMELQKKSDEDNIQKEMEFKKGLLEMKEEMRLRHEMEMSEVEERKNCHLKELKNIHKKRLNELKNFFNSITSDDLAVISSMRESLEGISKTKVIITDEMETLKKENKSLQKPLEKSKADVKNLMRQLTNYQKDLLSLKNNKRILKDTYSELDKIKNDSIAALDMLNDSDRTAEGGCLDASCVRSLVQFRNHAAARKKYLTETAENMLVELGNKKKILNQLSKDPDVNKAMSELNFEYWCPRKLQFDLNLAKTAYHQALSALEEKLVEFCVPDSTLAQGPWKVLPAYNTGPAGLVSKQ